MILIPYMAWKGKAANGATSLSIDTIMDLEQLNKAYSFKSIFLLALFQIFCRGKLDLVIALLKSTITYTAAFM